MKRTTKIKWGELKVGLLIAGAIAVLLWASFSGGGTSIFDAKVSYKTYFENVNGLVTGSPVWIAGLEVGNVYSVKIVNLDPIRRVEVKFRILQSVQEMVTADATVKVGTIGFIGDKYIEVIPGSTDLPVFEEGSEIPGQRPSDLGEMFGQGADAMQSVQDVAANLAEITDRMKKGQGSAGKIFTDDTLYNEMTRMLTALTALIGEFQDSQKKIVSSIESVSSNLDDISTKINNHEGSLGKFVAEPELYDNLRTSTGRIDSILAKINSGQGTAGAMVNDAELYEEIKNLVVRVENLVTDIEKNPKKYLKFSIF
nr:MCE family protein [candidate division Zixibacteria bacterium]